MNASFLKDLPAKLQEGERFVAWRYEEREGKKTKVPVNARTGGYASVTDPSTWSSLKETMEAAGRFGCSGVGRVVVAEDGYCGIDLDKCRDPQTGALTPLATTIVRTLNSYTEITPSCCGIPYLDLRGAARPSSPQGWCRDLYRWPVLHPDREPLARYA